MPSPNSKSNLNLSLRLFIQIGVLSLAWTIAYYLLSDVVPTIIAFMLNLTSAPMLVPVFTSIADNSKAFAFWIASGMIVFIDLSVYFTRNANTCHMCRKKLTIRESQYCLQHGLVSTCYSCQRRWPIG